MFYVFFSFQLSSPTCLIFKALTAEQEILSSNPNSGMDVCGTPDYTLNGRTSLFGPHVQRMTIAHLTKQITNHFSSLNGDKQLSFEVMWISFKDFFNTVKKVKK